MNLLYLSHCVPNPPDKGEKIRAHHQLKWLAARHRVHLVCFARSEQDQRDAERLRDICASISIHPLSTAVALPRAAVQFGAGRCLTTSFYSSPRMRAAIRALAQRESLDGAVVYSSAMAPHMPDGVPFLLDMVDVDSEKWAQYARMRHPGFVYGWESKRLRRIETDWARRAGCTFLSTDQEAGLLRSFFLSGDVQTLENGVDLEYFDPNLVAPPSELAGRRVIVFAGVMDYFPNSDGACHFAREIFPELRRDCPDLEFFVVGRNPSRAVQELRSIQGVTVTGSVPDVRPYLAAATAVVAPLRIARGVQNKVLEGLAMGKPVLASTAIRKTFGASVPSGVLACDTTAEYAAALTQIPSSIAHDRSIRAAARDRFSWERNFEILGSELARLNAR